MLVLRMSESMRVKSTTLVINNVPTHIMMYGELPPVSPELSEINKDSKCSNYLILVIPGNPGIIEFYDLFMKTVYYNFQQKVPVWGISHAGHVEISSMSEFYGNEVLYNLQDQVDHKVNFINTYVPSNVKLVLIGHSIGCYIILEIMKKLTQLNIIKSILLFPTIERMSISPHGKVITPLLSYLRGLLVLPIYLLSYLSPQAQYRILTWYFKNVNVPDCIFKAAMSLFSPDCIKNALFMCKDEMDKVTTLDILTIKVLLPKLIFYYGMSDHWCPVSYYQDMRELFPEGDIHLCEKGIDHAFVLESSIEVANCVTSWVEPFMF